MRRLFPLGLLLLSTSMSMGCAMCCSPYDYAFAYHGGAWKRDNLCTGRVGSVFDPAGSKVYSPEAKKMEEEVPPPAEPTPESAPKEKSKSDLNAEAPRPLKAANRTRPSRAYLPEND